MKPSEKLSSLTRANFIPLIGIFELTRRCNLKCVHCYIDQPKSSKNELSTFKVKRALSELAKAGTLNLVFTGGEIFLRDDIVELCRFARREGFDLRLFTNGTIINERSALELSKINLSGVEISLYGKRNTHDSITGVKGSFKKTLESIQLLTKLRIPVTVKCPIIKSNFEDYKWVIRFAKKHKLKYRFDPAIAAKDSGRKTNLKYRLSGAQLKSLFSDPVISGKPAVISGEPDLSCSAGVNMLTIGYDGKVYPCLQYLVPAGDLKKQKLSAIWAKDNRALRTIREISLKDLPVCVRCELAVNCQRCPGIALLEDKTLFGPSKIACEIARVQRAVSLETL